ncbi:MAG: hypothetical protein ACRCXT_07230 [Paraclostridium sp.]
MTLEELKDHVKSLTIEELITVKEIATKVGVSKRLSIITSELHSRTKGENNINSKG